MQPLEIKIEECYRNGTHTTTKCLSNAPLTYIPTGAM